MSDPFNVGLVLNAGAAALSSGGSSGLTHGGLTVPTGLADLKGSAAGLAAIPGNVAASGARALDNALTNAAATARSAIGLGSAANAVEDLSSTARVYGYAAIAGAVALSIAAVAFIVWNARKVIA